MLFRSLLDMLFVVIVFVVFPVGDACGCPTRLCDLAVAGEKEQRVRFVGRLRGSERGIVRNEPVTKQPCHASISAAMPKDKGSGPAPNALIAYFDPLFQYKKNAQNLLNHCIRPDSKGEAYIEWSLFLHT